MQYDQKRALYRLMSRIFKMKNLDMYMFTFEIELDSMHDSKYLILGRLKISDTWKERYGNVVIITPFVMGMM